MADLACLVGNDWIAPEERVHRYLVAWAASLTVPLTDPLTVVPVSAFCC